MATHSTAARNAQADEITTLVDAHATLAGTLSLWTASGGTKLAEVTLDDPSFGAASTGVITAAGFPKTDSSADATGTAAWFEVQDGAGTIVLSGSDVGTSGNEVTLVSTSITATQPVTFNSFTYTVPAS